MPKEPQNPPISPDKANELPFADTNPGRLSLKALRQRPPSMAPMAAKSRSRRGPAVGAARRLTIPGKGRGR